MTHLIAFFITAFFITTAYLLNKDNLTRTLLFKVKKESVITIKVFTIFFSIFVWIYILNGVFNLCRFIFKF
jgi:hypothetical protein